MGAYYLGEYIDVCVAWLYISKRYVDASVRACVCVQSLSQVLSKHVPIVVLRIS